MEENSRLLNKIVDEGEVESDRSIAKIMVLAASGVVFSFFFGYFLRAFVLDSSNWQSLLFLFLAAAGFMMLYLLDVFFIKAFWIVNLIIFSETLAFLAPFYDKISTTLMVVVLVSFLILISGNYLGRQELENMLKIKFWRVSKKVIPKAVFALALFTGAVYVGVSGVEQKGFFISESTFEKIISPITKLEIIQGFVPGFDLSLPTGQLIRNLAAGQLEGNQQFKLLSKTAQSQLIEESAKELENKISDFTGSPLDPKAKVSDVLYEIMMKKFGNLPANIKFIAPMIVAALIFLTIVGLSLPIRLVVSVLAFLIYEICFALGFSTIMMEGRSREIIVLR